MVTKFKILEHGTVTEQTFVLHILWECTKKLTLNIYDYKSFLDKCLLPVGIQDKRIPDGAFTSSSMHNYQHGPERARLHQPNNGRDIGAWAAKYNNKKQWLQIDLGAVSTLTGIATQGRHGAKQWVTSYYVQYSHNCQTFARYRENGRTRVRIFLLHSESPK